MFHKPFTRNQLRILLAAALPFLAFQSNATTNITDQMQLGNPSGATADTNNHNHYLIQRPVEALDFSDALGEPVWVSWDLTSGDVGTNARSQIYFTDTNLPANFYRVTDNDYNGVGAINFNRGHMCPSEDRTDTRADNDMVFLMSNIIPQAAVNNQTVWGDFEGDCRTLANSGNELLIICGPSGFGTNRIPSGKAFIANYTWKIAVVVPLGGGTALSRITASTRVISLNIPNSNTVSSVWQNYVTNAVGIQADTGFTFFTALPSNLATVLRNKIDGQTPPAPAITGFSPASGPTNSAVVITGTNFVFATNVTLHGLSATFNIDSTTQITATVPPGATSGSISVATLGGTATTSSNFTVTAAGTMPDLAILTSHTGNFTQGDVGDIYTVTVTNVGAAASSGSITVTDSLPAGLTITAISGSGWTTNLANLTATRADALGVGSAYPPIIFTVNVSGSAPASVTNTVTVSGGGETNLANNTASDPTTINPAALPTATTAAATGVGSTTATLNGTVNPNGLSTAVQFQYGLTTAYGSNVAFAGNFTGASPQAVTTNLTGLTPSTTYHFRLTATNSLGGTNGLDQSFTTTALPIVDLAVSTTHSGNFTQGDAADTYSIFVTNVGTAASSGSITVTDSLPAGLTITAMSGSGWTTNLANLTATRADTLAAGSGYPPITVTVSVAANAPNSVTNIVTVAGGGDANSANNTAMDPTTIVTAGGTLATNVVISQVYGGGGNMGATYQNDFVELFNPLPTAVNVSTWSVQYASAGGNSWVNSKVNLTGSIQPRHYYLIQLASQAAVGASLPVADATNTAINMAATSGGKLALVNNQIALTGNNPVGSNTVVDFVGYGSADAAEGASAAPVPSGNTTSMFRKTGGYTDSNTNSADFSVLAVVPRNSASPTNPPPVSVADLAISASHAGSFTQGDIGDTYTIIVTNLGSGGSGGSITVTDSLPAGLTATAIAGSGWTANLTNLTCTRSDTLAAGASYPPIVVTVNVATNAAASVTNLVFVSGGGQTITTNDTAADPTTIIALTPIQQWRLRWFGITSNSGPAADTAIASSDGMANLLKYALSLEPLTPASNPVVGDITTGYLRLTAPKNPAATDVTFHAEVTGKLSPPTWTTNGTTIDQNTTTLFQSHANAPVNSGTNAFIRLHISRP